MLDHDDFQRKKHTIIERHAINISWAVDARRCILLCQIKVFKSFAVKVVFHTSKFCRHHCTIENFRIRSSWILEDFWLWSCKCRLFYNWQKPRNLRLAHNIQYFYATKFATRFHYSQYNLTGFFQKALYNLSGVFKLAYLVLQLVYPYQY